MSADVLDFVKVAQKVLAEANFESPKHRLTYLSLAAFLEVHRFPAFAHHLEGMTGLAEEEITRILDSLSTAGLIEKRDAITMFLYCYPSELFQ